MADDPLTAELRPAAGEPQGALVLLHGRGTDRFDLLPLLDALDPERRLLGVTLQAPLQLPPGGYHWYVTRTVGHPDRETFLASLDLLERRLERLEVPRERTVIGGFSMGAVMSYALTLRAGGPAPAGLIALSGFMPSVEGFELDLPARAGLPAAIGHGTQDRIIGVEYGRAARDALQEAGARVVYRESPMGHGVDPAFVTTLRPWLAETLA